MLDEHRLALGVPSRVVPMCDAPVRTRVRSGGRWWEFQEFMIRGGVGADPSLTREPVEDVEFAGISAAVVPEAITAALNECDVVVVGPSNPVISIGPILAVLKGPTDAFMAWAGQPLSSDGIAATYAGVIDGLVADEPVSGDLPCLVRDVELGTPPARREVAAAVLSFAESLAGPASTAAG